jgi:hypothetical protein
VQGGLRLSWPYTVDNVPGAKDTRSLPPSQLQKPSKIQQYIDITDLSGYTNCVGVRRYSTGIAVLL